MKNNRYTKSLLAVGVFAGLTLSASMSHAATVYTWTGSVNGDWANAANWDANGVPVDDSEVAGSLGFQTATDRIVIDVIANGSSPTSNIPTLRHQHNAPGGAAFTPTVDVINGSVVFATNNSNSSSGITISGNTTTIIGDGDVNNGLASLTYTTSNEFRRDGGNMAITVNADGSLNFTNNSIVSFSTTTLLHVTLAGGAVNYAGTVDLLRNSTNAGNSWFDFTAEGSTFTASFGADFADLDTVGDYIGSGLTFRSSTDLALGAQDNGNGTFTVSVIPEPTTALLGGLGFLALLRRRR
jgi:hypothetical protein